MQGRKILVMVMLLVVITSCTNRKQKEKECLDSATQCVKTHFSEEWECIEERLSDGVKCRFEVGDPCILSCTCQEGEPQKVKYDCDDGNPCTYGMCGQKKKGERGIERSSAYRGQCYYYHRKEGVVCGPDGKGGECTRGLCVLLDGRVHRDHPRGPEADGPWANK